MEALGKVLVLRRWMVGGGMDLQDSETQHAHYTALYAPVELDIPEEEYGERGEDPVCRDGYYSYGVGEDGLGVALAAVAFDFCVPVLPGLCVITCCSLVSDSGLLTALACTGRTGTCLFHP